MMAPNTFKVAVSISNWPFRTTKNKLRILFENMIDGDVEANNCNMEYYEDDNDQLRWVLLHADGVALYAKMVEVICSLSLSCPHA